jgi:hypothetical protein
MRLKQKKYNIFPMKQKNNKKEDFHAMCGKNGKVQPER